MRRHALIVEAAVSACRRLLRACESRPNLMRHRMRMLSGRLARLDLLALRDVCWTLRLEERECAEYRLARSGQPSRKKERLVRLFDLRRWLVCQAASELPAVWRAPGQSG